MYSYSLREWIIFFYLYCFLGWLWESIFVSTKSKKWVNRGFLQGPMLPIYGSGAVMILFATLPVKENLFLVFIFGMIGATILEYITGLVMESLFHVRYWDYSDEKFNLKGHICLKCSLVWGIFSILMIKFIHPPIEALIQGIPNEIISISIISIISITIIIVIDFIHSFTEAMDLKDVLIKLTENNYREELLEFKESIKRRIARLEESASSKFNPAINMLNRNPGAIAKKYSEALEEIKKLIK